MEMNELLERYESLGEERDYLAAKPLYEQAAAGTSDPRILNSYGYLLYCHAQRELRLAATLYEGAIKLDPSYDKPHYQLISARAALREPERAIATYERRLADSPTELREHRFLAQAYLTGHDYARALAIAEAGLALAADDAALIATRGEARAGLGDVEGALADWQCALALEPEDIGALYSSAFLLEREGRLDESAAAWQAIIDWNGARGLTLETVWPKQELERLRGENTDER